MLMLTPHLPRHGHGAQDIAQNAVHADPVHLRFGAQRDPVPQGGERQVGIEDCEAVSREVSAQLDVADPISGHYTLEVSSPGVDRPLFTAAQFERFAGEQARVGLKLPQDGRRKLQGRILRAEGDAVVFEVDGAEFTVAMDNMDKARLVPDWAALGMAPAKKPGKKK